MPLAIAENRSIDPEDCIATDVIKQDGYIGEEVFMRYNPKQRYYYLSKQRRDELWLMRMGGYDPKNPSDPMTGMILLLHTSVIRF
jgi:hypothetical protein